MLNRAIVLFALTLANGCFYNPKGSTGNSTSEPNESTTSSAIPTTTATTYDKPACGNSVLEPGEQCDDGNATPEDGCEVDCTRTPGELCGNGTVDEDEECDDGNAVASDGCENNCTETVIPASCGDGKTDAGEECDDGNDDNTDACTNTCKDAVCGDGVVLAGTEECDDGNAVETDDCLSSCKAASCGDGQINEGVEVCDNGADNSDTAYDGCTTQCQLGPHCGDSEVQASEECDDGSPDGDDLCNACKNVPYRYVFVTQQIFNGDLNTLAGADIKCNAAADNANIEADDPVWKAWLSDNSQGAEARLDSNFVGWYVLPGPEPVLVARDWAGLASGTLLNPINHDETGAPLAADAMAWTNTATDGSVLSLDAHCSKWDLTGGTGHIGNTSSTDATWTNAQAPAACAAMHHLYCVQN